MQSTLIAAREMDGAIRPGLEDLRAYFAGEEGRRERALDFLKAKAGSTRVQSAENNELAMLMRLGKLSGATPEEIRPVFRAIVSRYASDGEASKEPPALEAAKSKDSKQRRA